MITYRWVNPSYRSCASDCGYELKGGGAPDTFLGATIGHHTFKDGTTTWYQSVEDYLKNAIKTIEEKLGTTLPMGRVLTPLEPDYHPEIDETQLVNDDRTNYYQSMSGILLWACQLGHIDIVQETGLMARFGAVPREGHLLQGSTENLLIPEETPTVTTGLRSCNSQHVGHPFRQV
jgi:hypothetical protein